MSAELVMNGTDCAKVQELGDDASTSPQRLNHDTSLVIDGWLMLRSRFSKKWKKRWFVLQGVHLRYGTSEIKLNGKISLDGARIRQADKDAKPYAFCIEPMRSHRRVYYIQAKDDDSRMKWMQAMCFAKFSHRSEDDDDNLKSLPCTIS